MRAALLRMAGRRFFALFVSLLATLVVFPFVEDTAVGGVGLNLLFTAVLASAIYGAGGGVRRAVLGVALASPWIAASWSYLLLGYEGLLAPGYVSAVCFNAFAVYAIVRHVSRAERVTLDLLFAALSAYMLIGVLWGFLYAWIEHLRPGSFRFQHVHRPDGALTWSDFVYFSFVSLTSTGYGDAAPISGHARSLAICEMIVGMMYPAALISRLASLYRSEAEAR